LCRCFLRHWSFPIPHRGTWLWIEKGCHGRTAPEWLPIKREASNRNRKWYNSDRRSSCVGLVFLRGSCRISIFVFNISMSCWGATWLSITNVTRRGCRPVVVPVNKK
jgi:hypothetical protein